MINDNELVRMEVLTFLVNRAHLKLSEETITRVFAFGGFDSVEVKKALTLLEGLRLIKVQYIPFGSTRIWSATSEGVLFFERDFNSISPPTLSSD